MKYSTMHLNKSSSNDFLKLYTLTFILEKGRPVYGKEVISRIRSFHTAWTPSHGTLYPLLDKMIEEGLIEHSHSKNIKKYYNITEKGKEYYVKEIPKFREMLISTVDFYTTAVREMESAKEKALAEIYEEEAE